MLTADDATSSSLLIEWANGEAAWIRQIVADILASKAKASDSDIERYFELLLKEKHLHTDAAPAVPLLPQSPVAGPHSARLLLKSLKIKGGVNALRDNEEISFGTRLTVVFGENGSGKSGYVRVLKRAAGVRSAEVVLGNVHKAAASSPAADVEFLLDDKAQPTLHWKNEEGVQPLTQIAAFDARAANAHIDEDLTYVYTPGELALFPLVQDAADRVRARLGDAIARASESRNPFLVHFKRGTTLYPLIETLGASTDLRRLKELATLTEAEVAHKAQLQTEVESLKATDLKAQLKVAEDQSRLVQGIAGALTAVLNVDRSDYVVAFDELNAALAKELEATSHAFSETSIPGVLADPWRRFIEAGEAYLRANGLDGDYPTHSAQCIYCRQPLAESAIELIRKYREFASGNARKGVEHARAHLSKCCEVITALNLDPLDASLRSEIDQGRGEAIRFFREPLAITAAFKKAVDEKTPTLPDTASLAAILPLAESTLVKLEETVTALRSKTTERERLLGERQGELTELEARTVLADLWPAVEKSVQEAKWADAAAQVNRGFTGMLRSLTEQAKTATQTLLNTNFESLFVEEARALRAPTVVLQFPGAKAQGIRRKVVANHRPSEILSEGEQKVVALADFIAETRVRQPHGPVVFDDPVNSLDFRRAEEVAARIKHLSKTHQVVVFTHTVMFASLLLEDADKKSTTYIDIRNDGAPGIASLGTHPRTDSASDLVKKIEARITAAKTAIGEVKESLLENGYSVIRALTEIITERGLLRGITARYRANVRVDGLDKLNTADMADAVKTVVGVYAKSCRYIEAHSQPLDHLGLKPTISELEADLTSLKEVLKKYPPVE